jgi:hypothetical protein
MPALPRPPLCPRHARGHREDDTQGIAVRPPTGSSACSMCRQEAAQAQDALAKSVAGTRNVEHQVSADFPDEDYPVTSPRVAARLDALRKHEKQEARRVEPAIAKMDNERPTTVELERSKPGPERQRAYERHMRVLNGGGRRRGSDVMVLMNEGGMDFDAAMASARAAIDAVLANAAQAGNKIEGTPGV